MVYIQCRDCEQLVARYVLAKGGYFHAGKGFESFLRSVERDGDFASARDINSTYDEIEAQIQAEFDTLTEKVTTLYKGKLP
ncbi:hypothetical protein [Teredinibacter waterburyi]|jgi:hypothetical protein|uniref:hypothetical protein n=1 Tax=Teredinibacter waterburyi TaxID=1500538 RepID=UPI001FE4E0B1|nr:hypothetical protein [Teredinibacter waterburyi]